VPPSFVRSSLRRRGFFDVCFVSPQEDRRPPPRLPPPHFSGTFPILNLTGLFPPSTLLEE